MQQQNPKKNNKHMQKNIKNPTAMKATTAIKIMLKTRTQFMINSPVRFM